MTLTSTAWPGQCFEIRPREGAWRRQGRPRLRWASRQAGPPSEKPASPGQPVAVIYWVQTYQGQSFLSGPPSIPVCRKPRRTEEGGPHLCSEATFGLQNQCVLNTERLLCAQKREGRGRAPPGGPLSQGHSFPICKWCDKHTHLPGPMNTGIIQDCPVLTPHLSY